VISPEFLLATGIPRMNPNRGEWYCCSERAGSRFEGELPGQRIDWAVPDLLALDPGYGG
jgi:hypothetical protein